MACFREILTTTNWGEERSLSVCLSNTEEPCLLAGLSLACPANFPIQHTSICPGMVLPTVGWTLLYLLAIKEVAQTQVNVIGAIPQVGQVDN